MNSDERIQNLTEKVAILIEEVNSLSNTIEDLLKENELLHQKCCLKSNNILQDLNLQKLENELISLKNERENLTLILFENNQEKITKSITYIEIESQLKNIMNELKQTEFPNNGEKSDSLKDIKENYENLLKEKLRKEEELILKNQDLEIKLRNVENELFKQKDVFSKEKKEILEKIAMNSLNGTLTSKKESFNQNDCSIIELTDRNDNSIIERKKKTKNNQKKKDKKLKEKKSISEKKSHEENSTPNNKIARRISSKNIALVSKAKLQKNE